MAVQIALWEAETKPARMAAAVKRLQTEKLTLERLQKEVGPVLPPVLIMVAALRVLSTCRAQLKFWSEDVVVLHWRIANTNVNTNVNANANVNANVNVNVNACMSGRTYARTHARTQAIAKVERDFDEYLAVEVRTPGGLEREQSRANHVEQLQATQEAELGVLHGALDGALAMRTKVCPSARQSVASSHRRRRLWLVGWLAGWLVGWLATVFIARTDAAV